MTSSHPTRSLYRITIAVAGLASALLAAPSTAVASGFGCAGVAGKVLFLDTIYGAATGLVVGGIVEVIRDDHEDWHKRLAVGTAIGAGVGLGLGGLEIGLRDCSEPSRGNSNANVEEKRWHVPALVLVPPSDKPGGSAAAGLRFSFATR